MKCPRCWAEKAYRRTVKGWKDVMLWCLLMEPMRCHHCYHKFSIPWFLAIGKEITPPSPKTDIHDTPPGRHTRRRAA